MMAITRSKQVADYDKQLAKLNLQSAKLLKPAATGFGKELKAQASQLATPNVSSAIMKALALGLGGQEQRKEAEKADESTAKMQQILESEIEKTQQLKNMELQAQKGASVEAYIGANGDAITNAIELVLSPQATPETIAEGNNTLTNILQSGGKSIGFQVNSASVDPLNQAINITLGDNTTSQVTIPEFISMVSKSNPELGKDAMSRLYPSIGERKAQEAGQASVAEAESAVGRPLTQTEKEIQAGVRTPTQRVIQGKPEDFLTPTDKAVATAESKARASIVFDSILKDIEDINPKTFGVAGQLVRAEGGLSNFVKGAADYFGIEDSTLEAIGFSAGKGIDLSSILSEAKKQGIEVTPQEVQKLQTLVGSAVFLAGKALEEGGRGLSDDERQFVQKLLGDPLSVFTNKKNTIEAFQTMSNIFNREAELAKRFAATGVPKAPIQQDQSIQNLLDKYK